MRIKKIMLCLFLFAVGMYAQESVGFKDPNDIKPLLDYRLPDWGYNVFRLSLDLNGSDNSSKQRGYERNANNNSLNLVPRVKIYRESEKQILTLNGSVGISRKTESNTSISILPDSIYSKSNYKQYSVAYNFVVNWNYYLKGRHFLDLKLNVNQKYEEVKGKSLYQYRSVGQSRSSKTVQQRVETYSLLGYGFGRVRDVTHTIRAMRFRERARVVGIDALDDPKAVYKIAELLSKYSSYRTVYDRSQKYFWRDYYELFSDLEFDAYKHYYIADALSENIGSRFEGWKVSFGLSHITYFNQSMSTSIEKSKNKRYGAYLNFQYYKNYSLRNQFSTKISGNYEDLSVEEFVWFNPKSNFSCEIRNLTVLTDRITWLNIFSAKMNYFKYNPEEEDITDLESKYYLDQKSFDLSTIFRYYIEDNVVLTANMQYLLSRPEFINPRFNRQNSFTYNIGIDYYFDKSLF